MSWRPGRGGRLSVIIDVSGRRVPGTIRRGGDLRPLQPGERVVRLPRRWPPIGSLASIPLSTSTIAGDLVRFRAYKGVPCTLCSRPLSEYCAEFDGRPYCHPCGAIALWAAQLREGGSVNRTGHG